MTTEGGASTTSGARGQHATGGAPSRMFWGSYVVLILALGFGRTIEKILRDSGGLQSRYGPALGATIIAIGVAGYVLSRPFGRRWLWGVVMVLAFCGMLGLLAMEFIVLITDDAPWRVHAMILASAVLLVPAQVALYRYVVRRPELWSARG